MYRLVDGDMVLNLHMTLGFILEIKVYPKRSRPSKNNRIYENTLCPVH